MAIQGYFLAPTQLNNEKTETVKRQLVRWTVYLYENPQMNCNARRKMRSQSN